ncbi:hypothetical protein [Ponticoccus litoralis]|uniref:Uncharacterized protein n=1 Tax=Ponticoccus litoralis TaxID=422297 RepID=A0AAW9SIL4_9RHOB
MQAHHADGVAVGVRLDDMADAGRSAGTGHVVDHNRGIHDLGQLMTDQATHQVMPATRGPDHGDVDRFAGVGILRKRGGCRKAGKHRQTRERGEELAAFHGVPFVFSLLRSAGITRLFTDRASQPATFSIAPQTGSDFPILLRSAGDALHPPVT